MNIFWFRRDLRLEDNAGLFHALSGDAEVLPIFIFDTNILGELPKDDPRVTFIHELLEKINAGLKKHGRSLAVFHGDPEAVFKKLIETHKISTVFANRDYEPYGTNRDAGIEKLLSQHKITFHTFKDQVVFETDEIAKDGGSPYVVFTPYSKKWKEKFAKTNIPYYASEHFLKNMAPHSYPFLSLDDIHFIKSEIAVPDFEASDDFIMQYEQTRNFPEKQTSRLGPHVRFGSVSIREIIAKANAAQNPTFLNELIWREFFMQVLWHFPQTVTKSFRPKYDNIKWRNAEADFKKWCEGKTGYPIVDAGMRELNATGFMHNRVRMVTASFLCKHLLIDWRLGEAWFAEKLLDYEQSSNIGNWQWAAGSGVDAAPYFRIFNPTEQLKKFDKELSYIRKWIPEFGTVGYPRPMVDHKEARERCLEAYKKAVS
jgi:deoxyribodipyrimidine photo-lyase